jgi:hypothetical protein
MGKLDILTNDILIIFAYCSLKPHTEWTDVSELSEECGIPVRQVNRIFKIEDNKDGVAMSSIARRFGYRYMLKKFKTQNGETYQKYKWMISVVNWEWEFE